MLKHLKNDKKVTKSIMVTASAVLLLAGVGIWLAQDKTVRQYNAAKQSGDVAMQLALAEQLVKRKPDAVDITYSQLDAAKVSLVRLEQNRYEFADNIRLRDARQVLKVSPNAEIARYAEQKALEQQQQLRAVKQKLGEIYQIETGFNGDFHVHPVHRQIINTSVKLPKYAAGIDQKYYIGALYNRLNKAPLNDYQLKQLVNHQNQVLNIAVPLKVQMDKLAEQMPLGDEVAQIHQSIERLTDFHQQTMQYLLVTLIRDGVEASGKVFEEISKVASSQMTRGNFDKVWQNQISPLSHKQWKWFHQAYLDQIQLVRGAILAHRSADPREIAALAQTFPHSELAYKYFWPKDDLAAFRDQGPQRKLEADKILKALDGIKFDNFDSLGQSYAALAFVI